MELMGKCLSLLASHGNVAVRLCTTSKLPVQNLDGTFGWTRPLGLTHFYGASKTVI